MPIGRGVIPKKVKFALRSATREDLVRLEGTRSKVHPAKLRHSHHMVARLAAAGLRLQQIADQTGYAYNRVSVLLGSPAMKDLVAHYKGVIDKTYAEGIDAYFQLATGNMIAAERHIADRIAECDEAGELLPVREAIAISRDAADRFGYGKKQTNVNVNVDFAAKLETRNARLKTIDGTVQTTTPVASNQPLAVPSHLPPIRRVV